MSKTRLTGPKALLTATLLALAAPVPAQAQGILDLGKMLLGIEDEKPEIEYRERAPLVVPPKTELPAPRERASAANPNWPKDPDIAARKAAEEARKRPAKEDVGLSKNPLLSVDEMRAGRKPGAGVPTGPERNIIDRPHLSLQEMRELDAKSRVVAAPSGVEQPRRWLTDPPSGYRKPAPGAPVVAPDERKPTTNWRDEDAFSVYRNAQ